MTVAGEVARSLAPHVAVLDGALYGREDILLVSDVLAPGAFPTRAPVRVTGVLSRFDLSEAERRAGADLDDAVLDEFEGDLVLYAEDLHFFLSGPSTRNLALDLVGRDATVLSSVDQVYGTRLFSVEGGLLVLAPEAGVPAEGTVIEATGAIHVLTPALLQEHGTAIELENDIGNDGVAEGAPVLVAKELVQLER